ncbi:MAG: small acid-soluble spore protein SspI [Bacilli bacterium]|nr:small acid-soluble spore protein SspI [Bacilli bacterium]
MNISIKEHIINNFKNDNEDDIMIAINESVENNDEITLPGLGVFMNLLWEQSNKEEKEKIVKKIKEALAKN